MEPKVVRHAGPRRNAWGRLVRKLFSHLVHLLGKKAMIKHRRCLAFALAASQQVLCQRKINALPAEQNIQHILAGNLPRGALSVSGT